MPGREGKFFTFLVRMTRMGGRRKAAAIYTVYRDRMIRSYLSDDAFPKHAFRFMLHVTAEGVVTNWDPLKRLLSGEQLHLMSDCYVSLGVKKK